MRLGKENPEQSALEPEGIAESGAAAPQSEPKPAPDLAGPMRQAPEAESPVPLCELGERPRLEIAREVYKREEENSAFLKETYLSCKKAEYLHKNLVHPLIRLGTLEFGGFGLDRNVTEFLYLVNMRSFSSISMLHYRIEHDTELVLTDILRQAKWVYDSVKKAFESSSAKLT